MDNCKEKIDLGHYWDLQGLMLSPVTGSADILSMQNKNNPNLVKSMETPLVLRFFYTLIGNATRPQ